MIFFHFDGSFIPNLWPWEEQWHVPRMIKQTTTTQYGFLIGFQIVVVCLI